MTDKQIEVLKIVRLYIKDGAIADTVVIGLDGAQSTLIGVIEDALSQIEPEPAPQFVVTIHGPGGVVFQRFILPAIGTSPMFQISEEIKTILQDTYKLADLLPEPPPSRQ